MKRQRGRNRGGGNTGGGQKPTHNVNRAFDSNGPDGVKIRGAAQHVFEKYSQLARDASASGDRVLGENYLQHAEHYFRLIRAVQPMKPASEIIGRDSFAGYDIDFEDESGQVQQEAADNQYAATAAAAEENGGEAPRAEYRDNNGGQQRDNGPREARQDNFREPRQEWRRDRDSRDNNGGQQRDNNNRPDNNRQEARRDDRPPREDRPRNRDRDRDRDRPDRADPMPVVEPEATPLTAPAYVAPAPAPAPSEDFQLRSQDGDLSPAPAFLQPRTDAEAGEAKRPRAPRRRRAPRGFEEGGAPAAETEEA